ncbi:MAG: hypothetical protein HEQ22_03435 [Sphingopyxis sp.]|uniref:hypothetical protein n=1 Tax=Sphingopyxis sp. TaxID=1908224 RepID=UPI003D810DEE
MLSSVQDQVTQKAGAQRVGMEQLTQQSGAQRAGMQQLSMQISDVATMYSLGARPMQIFSSQIGQITQAVQLASGGSSRFAAIMGSPWTMAITTAAIVLVPLISNLFDTEDAADKAGKANETLADKLDRTKSSYAEVVAAVREYNAEQKKATETTLENAGAVAAAAAANLREALSIRQKLSAQLAGQQVAARASAGQGTGGAAGAYIGGQVGVTQAEINANEAAIDKLTQDALDATTNVAEQLATLDTDATAKIKFEAEQRRKAVRQEVATLEEKRKKLAEITRQEQAAIDAANKTKRSSSRTGSTAASSASVGDMTALIKALFPGATITSTTGGKHTPGSDHYKGNAVDFVIPGMMNAAGTAIVEKMLEEAGVTIRRNARGTKQFFGPGRSASKPGDHDDHFHAAWSGSASPEEAQRRAAQAAERAARAAEQEERRKERYSRDLAGLQDAALDLEAQLGQTAEERYQLERQGLEISIAEQRRRIDASTDYTAAEKATLIAALEKKASMERELLHRRRAEELARQALEIAQAMGANQFDLLRNEARLAETREERRAIELRILELTYQQERAALEAVLASRESTDAQKQIARARLAILGQLKAGDRAALDREYESPLERYRRELGGVGKNINDEMEKVAVNGLERLSDGLTDVIMGAKSLGDVFKQVAKQIIADLIRIFIQQQLILPLLNALGGGSSGGIGGAIGGGGFNFGSIFAAASGGFNGGIGGGGGAGASILSGVTKFAGLFAEGGMIPNGSFGIVGEAGPEPVFATGGGIGVLPNSALRSMGGGGGGSAYFDLRGAVMTEDLLRQMNSISQANVRSGLETYDSMVGERVTDNLARKG